MLCVWYCYQPQVSKETSVKVSVFKGDFINDYKVIHLYFHYIKCSQYPTYHTSLSYQVPDLPYHPSYPPCTQWYSASTPGGYSPHTVIILVILVTTHSTNYEAGQAVGRAGRLHPTLNSLHTVRTLQNMVYTGIYNTVIHTVNQTFTLMIHLSFYPPLPPSSRN